jgi:hypothetical protein
MGARLDFPILSSIVSFPQLSAKHAIHPAAASSDLPDTPPQHCHPEHSKLRFLQRAESKNPQLLLLLPFAAPAIPRVPHACALLRMGEIAIIPLQHSQAATDALHRHALQ